MTSAADVRTDARTGTLISEHVRAFASVSSSGFWFRIDASNTNLSSMPKITLTNSPLELTTILIRHHRIHRGLWTLNVNLQFQGTNYRRNDSATLPSALIMIQGIGIREVEVADALTVDAAAVNPAPAMTRNDLQGGPA
jgi:hypothetical protein